MKKWCFVVFFGWSQMLVSQDFSQSWKGYFAYNEIVDVAHSTQKIVAATPNALFQKNTSSTDVTTINSINGFKPENISAIYHSESTNKTFAGNTNGLLVIINANGSISNKIDIISEVPVPPTKKKINSFYENNGKLYIATNYGISVLNISNSEFIATYFIGNSGEETPVLQTTIFNNDLYAVTQNQGIRKISITNPSPFDFSQWQTFDNGYWAGITTFNNKLVATNTNSLTYLYNGSSFEPVFSQAQNAIKFKSNANHLTITTPNHIYVLDQNFQQIAHITEIPNNTNVFSSATTLGSKLYIGTAENGFFETDLSNPTQFNDITPNGPERNSIFRIKKTNKELWAVYGGYDKTYNPYTFAPGAPNTFPISYYNETDGWKKIPYSDLLETKAISGICSNPKNENEIYFTSYFSGLLKVKNKIPEILYKTSNSGLGESFPNDIRVNSPAFDSDNKLWITVSRAVAPLKSFNLNSNWQSFGFNNLTTNVTADNYTTIQIDRNKTKWIATYRNGLVAFNENYNNKTQVIDVEDGNLPDTDVRAIALDNNQQLWIGTAKGLRVIRNTSEFITANETLKTAAIIIQEGDLAQELFYQQSILDIAVDGANRKWVSILDGGVFLVSSNGQETIHNFTKSNSPLPSNNVVDIEIDGVSGEVFFATEKGLVSFVGTATKPSETLDAVYVYPNPVRPDYLDTVKISGLTDKANVKITDIEGNLVYETTSSGGTIEWDTTAFGSHKVASGVYMVFVASKDGLDSTVKKVMIIR